MAPKPPPTTTPNAASIGANASAQLQVTPDDTSLTPAQRAQAAADYANATAAISPIGVPTNYQVNGPHGSDPRYRTGNNLTPWSPDDSTGSSSIGPGYFEGSELMFAGASEEAVWGIQQDLIAAGLIADKDPYLKGRWDDTSSSAFKYVLAYANTRGLTWQAALDEYKVLGADAMARAKASVKGPVFTARLTNPDDLAKAFRTQAYQSLGGGFIDESQIANMTSAYNQIELSSQKAAFNAQTGSGGTVVDAPTAATFAEDQLKQIDPEGVKATKFAGHVKVLEGLLGG